MSEIERRRLIGSTATPAVFTIVPRHVLRDTGHVAMSDKITVAHIGMGSQRFEGLGNLLADPEIRNVAEATKYMYCDFRKGWEL